MPQLFGSDGFAKRTMRFARHLTSATGTDSKAGTLVHEMSHFNVVASTDDHAYGTALLVRCQPSFTATA
ncbi:MAG: M35 family metallo-endopeptidase [Thermoanaerobaculia bacterium]